MSPPAELRLAIDAGDDAYLYRVVADWWRDVRHPRLAEVALAIARRGGAHQRPAVGGMRNIDHDRWLALAKAADPFDLHRLLASLVVKTASVLGRHRLSAIEVDDPHLVPGMFALLRKPPSRNHGGKPLWLYLCERMTSTPDIRVRHELDDYLPQLATYMDSSTGDWLRRRLQELLAAQPVHPPALDVDDLRAISELERELDIKPPPASGVKRSAADVLAQIYAEPDDDGAREVYADIIGGEIGEFIVSQLRGSTAQPPPAIANALLGALTGITSRATFVRGFPEELVIWKRPSTIRPAIGLPGWALVWSISITHAGWVWPEDVQRAAVKLLTHPVMTRLEALGGVALASLDRLKTMPSAPSIEKLGVVSGEDGAEHAAALDAFPALATLRLTAWHQGPFAIPESLLARLDLLVIDSSAYAWWTPLSASQLRRFRLEFHGVRLDFARTSTGLDDVVLEIQRPNAILSLDLLPAAAIRSIVIRPVPAQLAATLTAQLERFPGAAIRYE